MNNSFSNISEGSIGYNSLTSNSSIIGALLPNSMRNFGGKSQQSNANETKNKSGMSVVDIKELVENYAHKFFKENEKEYYRKLGKSHGWKEYVKQIDWKKMRIYHEPIVYRDINQPGKPKSHVLFRSTFLNDTTKEQDYQINVERKTVSSCNFEIFEGYVAESSVELSIEIPLPCPVIEAGVGFKREYTLENTRSKSVEEEMTWSIQSNIKVPGMSKTTAELLVEEDEYKGQFEMKTYFSGEIKVKLFKDGLDVLLIELGDLDEIFTRERGFGRDDKGIFRVTKGVCKARYGIEQKIELHQKPLKEH